MIKHRISQSDIAQYKNQVLSQSVLVTQSTAAEILAVSPRTVRRLVDNGQLAAYASRPNCKGLRILAHDLKEYVRSIKIDKFI